MNRRIGIGLATAVIASAACGTSASIGNWPEAAAWSIQLNSVDTPKLLNLDGIRLTEPESGKKWVRINVTLKPPAPKAALRVRPVITPGCQRDRELGVNANGDFAPIYYIGEQGQETVYRVGRQMETRDAAGKYMWRMDMGSSAPRCLPMQLVFYQAAEYRMALVADVPVSANRFRLEMK